MNCRRVATLTFLISLVFEGLVIGYPAPSAESADITRLIATSDIVCKGSVLEVRKSGNSTGRWASWVGPSEDFDAFFRVDRFYKGGGRSINLKIQFKIPQNYAQRNQLPFLQLEPGDYVLLFLSDSGEKLSFADEWFGRLDVSPRQTDAWDGNEPIQLLEMDLRAGLSDSNRMSVLENIRLLGGMKRLNSTVELKKLTSSPDREVQGSALLSLMKVNDFSQLRDAIAFLELTDSSARIVNLQYQLRSAFENISDSKVIPTMVAHINSPSTLARSAIVKTLKRIGSPRTVPLLIAKLDDSDPGIRFDAMVALVLIENKDESWAVSLRNFEQEESKIRNRWKEWWQTEGKYKYGSPPPKQSSVSAPLQQPSAPASREWLR